jgi:hypothetical protein
MTRSKDTVATAALAEAYLRQFPDEAVKDLEGADPGAIIELLSSMEPLRAGSLSNRLSPSCSNHSSRIPPSPRRSS